MKKPLVRLVAMTIALATTSAIGWAAVCFREIVTESDVVRQPEDSIPTGNWVLYFRPGTGTAAFVVGPQNPPAGVGSLEMQTPLVTDKMTLFNYDHRNTPLTAITAIGYSTYRDSASTGPSYQLPSINIEIDKNGGAFVAGDYTTLVYEPVYNVPTTSSIVNDQWQTWDAYNGGQGIWWSTRPINGCLIPPCYMTWDFIVANNPNATILGGFGVNQGSGSAGLIASTDALNISHGDVCVLYDFEPFRSTNQCKKGGWQTMRRADNTEFKNQGDCVSYVNTGR